LGQKRQKINVLSTLSGGFVEAIAGGEEGLDVAEGHHRGDVGFGVFGVGVTLEEEAVDAGGDGGFGEERGELGVAAGLIA